MMPYKEREILTEVKKRLIEISDSDNPEQGLKDYIREITITTGVNKVNMHLIRDL